MINGGQPGDDVTGRVLGRYEFTHRRGSSWTKEAATSIYSKSLGWRIYNSFQGNWFLTGSQN